MKVCFVHNTPVLLSLSLFLYTLTVDLERTAQPLAYGHNRKLFELAIAWILAQPAVTGAIVGIRNAREAEQMLTGSNWIFTEEERAEIEKALTLWES